MLGLELSQRPGVTGFGRAKNVVLLSRVKVLRTNTFQSGYSLVNPFKLHMERNLRMEREESPVHIYGGKMSKSLIDYV